MQPLQVVKFLQIGKNLEKLMTLRVAYVVRAYDIPPNLIVNTTQTHDEFSSNFLYLFHEFLTHIIEFFLVDYTSIL